MVKYARSIEPILYIFIFKFLTYHFISPFCGSFVSLNVRDVVKEYRFADNIKTFLVFQVLLLHVFGYSNAVDENENVLPAFLMYLFVFYCIFMFLISIL